MVGLGAKSNIIEHLQKEVVSLQGFKRSFVNKQAEIGLAAIEKSFPGHVFPVRAVHEFISTIGEDAAATNGFIAGIISALMQQNGSCLWISNKRKLFPPALKLFGIDPERIVFIDLNRQKDVLWAIEEALKCKSLSAVVGELGDLSFTESRRLQLAVEESNVTGFIHRYNPLSENIVACVTRWRIKHVTSFLEDGMPGVGFPRWNVRLVKVRNGKPGAWTIEWTDRGFRHITERTVSLPGIQTLKTG